MQLNRLQQIDGPDPESLTAKDFMKLLLLSNNQRKNYYRYLYKTQFHGNDIKVNVMKFVNWRLFIYRLCLSLVQS